MGIGGSAHPANASCARVGFDESDPCGDKTETVREATLEAVPLASIDTPVVFPCGD